MSDLVINVKQIASYPSTGPQGSDTILLQRSGLGGPYMSVTAAALVAQTLADSGPLAVGRGDPPADADMAQIFTGNIILGPYGSGAVLFNAYINAGGIVPWTAGSFGLFNQSSNGFEWLVGSGQAGQPGAIAGIMTLSNAGALNLGYGTITVARDPSTPMEVATLNYVGNNTVASFNNRIGPVQLTQTDIYNALGYTDYIATQPWTINAINAGIGNLITTYPLVTTFNTRTGDILLTLSDITCTFFQPGQQPISPTPIATSNDNSIATTQWVTTFVQSELSGSGSVLASQSWVLANTVNSFNGRQGPVTLTQADVLDVGAAPLNSPAFSGIPNAPTANPGTSTGQLATTAFVQAAVTAGTAGVSSFNTRTGAVVLNGTDIANAGGLSNPNAALTGTPTAPTATAGTNTTQLATTQFVTTAVNASVVSFNTRTGAVSLQLADITGVGGAPLASPTFTGIPAAPTASPGTNTTQLATTSFVTQALTAAGGVSSFNSRTGAVTLTTNDVSAAGGLTNPSPNLTGTPTAPTAAPATNTTQIASTAFVTAAVNASVVSFNTRTGAITLAAADITGAGGAVLASPAFTGAPTAPTATAGTNNTQLATTAFVAAAISAGTAGVSSWNTRTGAVTLQAADITGVGGALLASPALSGVPTAPTATAGTSTTQIATTQFVQSAVSTGAVSSFNSRTGAVTLQANDISAATGALIASPTFTGTPAAPTAATNTNTTQLATTAYVVGQAGTANPTMDSTASVGTSLLYARQDHQHPSDTSRAPVASPTFTGTPAAPTATAGTSTTQLATTQFVASAITASAPANPNAVDNAGFAVNQRSYVTNTALASGTFGHDRWKGGASGCTYTFTQSPGPATTITITAGSLQQVIEGAGLAGGNYMLSWTGTAQGRVGAGTYAASPVTVTAITAGANTTIEFNAGTLGTVKFEAGTTATAWRPDPAQVTLARCQRFYAIAQADTAFAAAAAGAWGGSAVYLPVTMRAVPTITTFTAVSGANVQAPTLNNNYAVLDAQTIWAMAQSAAAGTASYQWRFAVSADL